MAPLNAYRVILEVDESDITAIRADQVGSLALTSMPGEVFPLTVTQVTVSKAGIPFLVDLPILGRIFGFTSRREQRRDLLILVTPHIVDEVPENSPPDRQ